MRSNMRLLVPTLAALCILIVAVAAGPAPTPAPGGTPAPTGAGTTAAQAATSAAAAPGSTQAPAATTAAASTTKDKETRKGHIPKTVLWHVPPSSLMAAIVFFTLAFFAPLVVKVMLRRLEVVPEKISKAYGTFAALDGAGGEQTGPLLAKPTLESAPSRPVTDRDLPPSLALRWDTESWRLVHDELNVPLGFSAFVLLAAIGVQLLRLPLVSHHWPVRSIVESIVMFLAIFCGCWCFWRAVDLAIKVIARQEWISRSRMSDMYDEIAGKVGVVLKLLGGLLIVVVMSGVLSDEDSMSKKLFFAFLAALALGLCGWILLELSGMASEYISAMQMMFFNMFEVGDEVSFYKRDHGAVKGVLVATDTRTSELLTSRGNIAHITNLYVMDSVVVNHSRSLPTVNFDLYLDASTPADKLRSFSEAASALLSEHAVVNTQSKATAAFRGDLQAGALPLTIHCFLAPDVKKGAARDALMMDLLELAQSQNVTFAAGA